MPSSRRCPRGHVHERRPVQEAGADGSPDLLPAPSGLPEGEGRRNDPRCSSAELRRRSRSTCSGPRRRNRVREGQDWSSELKAGRSASTGQSGWHTGLQELIDMNERGLLPAGTGRDVERGGGRGVRAGAGPDVLQPHRRARATIDAATRSSPTRSIRSRRDDPNQTMTSARTSPSRRRQRALERRQSGGRTTFINFIARPEQNALLRAGQRRPDAVRVPEGADSGLHVQPRDVLAGSRLRLNPDEGWWNPSVRPRCNRTGSA